MRIINRDNESVDILSLNCNSSNFRNDAAFETGSRTPDSLIFYLSAQGMKYFVDLDYGTPVESYISLRPKGTRIYFDLRGAGKHCARTKFIKLPSHAIPNVKMNLSKIMDGLATNKPMTCSICISPPR